MHSVNTISNTRTNSNLLIQNIYTILEPTININILVPRDNTKGILVPINKLIPSSNITLDTGTNAKKLLLSTNNTNIPTIKSIYNPSTITK